MADEDPPRVEETVSPGGVIIPASGTLVPRQPEAPERTDPFANILRPPTSPGGLDWEEVGAEEITLQNITSGGPQHLRLVPVESFYNSIRRSPRRLPDGLFLFANGETVWCNGAHEELLDYFMSLDERSAAAPYPVVDQSLDARNFRILGHRIQYIKTGVEGDVTMGVYGMRGNYSLFRRIMNAMNREGSRENAILTELFTRIATKWLGFGRTEISSADDKDSRITEIIIRHHPDSPTGPKRYRWTMRLDWEMLESMVELGTKGIEPFWQNVEKAYEEECRRVAYRQQEGKALGDRIVKHLAELREMIADRRHQDDIDRTIRMISDLESRLRDGSYWEEF